MFTGIVTDMGRVRRVEKPGDTHITIGTRYDVSAIDFGASIACSGICMTVIDKGSAKDPWFAVSASAETVSRTTAGRWNVGDVINLERPVRVGDEIGGHIVTGHVDGTAELVRASPEGESVRMTFRAKPDLARFIASKGSIALDGVSLTVNEADDAQFGVNIIPHTLKATTFGNLDAGGKVNLEVDLIARYVARLLKI